MPWLEVSIVEQRREFVRLASQEGANRHELCRRFGIHPSTGYKWLARWASGEGTLAAAKRRPVPPSVAKRNSGAPFGNRNAAIKVSPQVLAFEARVRDLMARAKAAIARAERVIAAQAAAPPPVHVMVYAVIRDGVEVRQRTVTLSSSKTPAVAAEMIGQTDCENPRPAGAECRSAPPSKLLSALRVVCRLPRRDHRFNSRDLHIAGVFRHMLRRYQLQHDAVFHPEFDQMKHRRLAGSSAAKETGPPAFAGADGFDRRARQRHRNQSVKAGMRRRRFTAFRKYHRSFSFAGHQGNGVGINLDDGAMSITTHRHTAAAQRAGEGKIASAQDFPQDGSDTLGIARGNRDVVDHRFLFGVARPSGSVSSAVRMERMPQLAVRQASWGVKRQVSRSQRQ